MRKKKILSWLVVVLIMGIIYYFSDQKSVVSSGTSNGVTRFIYDLLDLDNLFDFDSFHVLIRKLAHFSIYALLGVFMFNAIFYTMEREYIYLLVLSLFLVFGYACLDEIHQLFVLGRSCEFRDVIIDTSGGSIGSLVYYFYVKIGCVKYDLSQR
jgi:VanZ family protein